MEGWPPHLCVAQTLFAYEAITVTDVSVASDSLVLVCGAREDVPEGWTFVMDGQQSGLLPTSYLSLATSGTFTAQALFDFSATGTGEVSFISGDYLRIDPSDTDPSGWVAATHKGSNHQGLVPSAYLQVVSLITHTPGAASPKCSTSRWPVQHDASTARRQFIERDIGETALATEAATTAPSCPAAANEPPRTMALHSPQLQSGVRHRPLRTPPRKRAVGSGIAQAKTPDLFISFGGKRHPNAAAGVRGRLFPLEDAGPGGSGGGGALSPWLRLWSDARRYGAAVAAFAAQPPVEGLQGIAACLRTAIFGSTQPPTPAATPTRSHTAAATAAESPSTIVGEMAHAEAAALAAASTTPRPGHNTDDRHARLLPQAGAGTVGFAAQQCWVGGTLLRPPPADFNAPEAMEHIFHLGHALARKSKRGGGRGSSGSMAGSYRVLDGGSSALGCVGRERARTAGRGSDSDPSQGTWSCSVPRLPWRCRRGAHAPKDRGAGRYEVQLTSALQLTLLHLTSPHPTHLAPLHTSGSQALGGVSLSPRTLSASVARRSASNGTGGGCEDGGRLRRSSD
jgi:hypothetical protein